MPNYMTWREIRNRINEMDESKLDEVATVSLDDMVWMMDEGGTAGSYPVTSINDGIVIDEYYGYRDANLKHITAQEVIECIESGLIQLADEHGEVVCRIGKGFNSNWFYFAGLEGESMTAAEYMEAVPLADIAREIADVLSGFEESDYMEWGFYRSLIDEDKED